TADVAAPDHGGVEHASLGLLGLQPLAIDDAVLEFERVLGPDVGEPLLEALLVEQLPDALARGEVEVMLAFGADVEARFRLLAKDGRLALGTANPQSYRYAVFFA